MTLSVVPLSRLHHIVCTDGMIRIAPIRVHASNPQRPWLVATPLPHPIADALTRLAMATTAFYMENNIALPPILRTTLYNANRACRNNDEPLQRATLILLCALAEASVAITDPGVVAALGEARRALNTSR